MNHKDFTKLDIDSMSYEELVSLVKALIAYINTLEQNWRVVSSRHKILGNFQQSLYYYGFMRLHKRYETRSKKRWKYCV